MASYAKPISFLFLIALFSIAQVQARESKFFSKITHNKITNNNVKEYDSAASPFEAPAPGPEPAQEESGYGNGYGLYGHGSAQFPAATKTTAANGQNEFLNEEVLASESYKESKTSYPNNNNNYNNNEHANSNYNTKSNTNSYNSNNGYTTSNYNTKSNTNSYYSNNGYTTSNYNNNNGYESKRQGMSDTRFVENGRYYYDIKNENNAYVNGYDAEKGSESNEGYYDDNLNSNEFNSMEEYESQEEFQENPEKYQP